MSRSPHIAHVPPQHSLNEQAAHSRPDHDTLRLAVKSIFAGPQGALVLRHLKSRALIGRSPFSRHTQPLELAFIEGRRSLVWELDRFLADNDQ